MTQSKRFRFMNNNFATSSTVTSSSADSTKVLANLTSDTRGKEFTFAGHFKIDATNDRIYINDGSAKTGVISQADYTTPAALANAINGALNAVSSQWVVAYDVNENRFSIVHNVTAHTLVLSNRTNAVWDTIGFVTQTDTTVPVAPSSPLLADDIRIHSEEYIDIDVGADSMDMTFFALFPRVGVRLGTSAEATVRLHANNLPQFASPALTYTPEVSAHGVFVALDTETDTAYRYWRLSITDVRNSAGPGFFSGAAIYLGDHLESDLAGVARGFTKVLADPSDKIETETGAIFTNDRAKVYELGKNDIAFIRQDEREALEQLFYDKGYAKPFPVSFDPTTCATDNLHELTKLVTFTDEPIFTHIKFNLYGVGFKLREAV